MKVKRSAEKLTVQELEEEVNLRMQEPEDKETPLMLLSRFDAPFLLALCIFVIILFLVFCIYTLCFVVLYLIPMELSYTSYLSM